MFSRFFHIVAHISTFLLKARSFIVCIYHSLFIYSSIEGPLACFHLVPVMSSAAVNMNSCVSFRICLLFDALNICTEVKLT